MDQFVGTDDEDLGEDLEEEEESLEFSESTESFEKSKVYDIIAEAQQCVTKNCCHPLFKSQKSKQKGEGVQF